MNWDLTTKISTAVVALYGAIIGTINIIQRNRENRPNCKVSISFGWIASGASSSPDMIFAGAANSGGRNLTLSLPTLRIKGVPDRIMLPIGQSNVRFPCELSSGQSCNAWVEAAEIASLLKEHGCSGTVKLAGQYTDAVGNRYISKWMRFSIDKHISPQSH